MHKFEYKGEGGTWRVREYKREKIMTLRRNRDSVYQKRCYSKKAKKRSVRDCRAERCGKNELNSISVGISNEMKTWKLV